MERGKQMPRREDVRGFRRGGSPPVRADWGRSALWRSYSDVGQLIATNRLRDRPRASSRAGHAAGAYGRSMDTGRCARPVPRPDPLRRASRLQSLSEAGQRVRQAQASMCPVELKPHPTGEARRKNRRAVRRDRWWLVGWCASREDVSRDYAGLSASKLACSKTGLRRGITTLLGPFPRG